jgi:H+-translocating NAD(P) transhydrogenase subunit alpha
MNVMHIGIPKEILEGEKRVAATPDTVTKYREKGYTVHVEQGAGNGALITDDDYAKAGAVIEPDAGSLFAVADLILKVKEPVFNSALGQHEVDLIREGTTLVTFLHPAAPGNHEMVERLRARRIASFTMDGIPRISRAQRMDALTSMSTLTGYKSVLMAACSLPVVMPLVGTAIGPLKPARVLVIGAGVVGLQSIATAKRLGSLVSAVDTRATAREAAASLGASVVGFEVPAEMAEGPGGYALPLPAPWLEKERDMLLPLIEKSDIIILSALVPGEVAPPLISSEMVNAMRRGSVIVDVSIDQGGNCDATVPGMIHTVNGVMIIGTKNIPGSLPVHATWLYANNMFYFMENLCKSGPGQLNLDDEIVRSTLVTIDGKIMHEGTLKALGIN